MRMSTALAEISLAPVGAEILEINHRQEPSVIGNSRRRQQIAGVRIYEIFLVLSCQIREGGWIFVGNTHGIAIAEATHWEERNGAERN